jgi:ParB family transcriptional regulator, chromosome partitioning protein
MENTESGYEVKMVKLSALRTASEAPESMKLVVRKAADRDADFAGLVASINAVGLLHPLQVVQQTTDNYIDIRSFYFVVSGNRRLRALRQLHNGGDISVPVVDVGRYSGQQLRDLAVMANVNLPMHPIDQFEVLAGAKKDGMSEADIASRWGLTPKRVRQVLAFGALSSTIREAWRAGEIDADDAAAFTLTDADHQDKVFAKLKKQGCGISAGQIEREIIGKQSDAGRFLTFVGIDEYRFRGGNVREDLFGTSHQVDDIKLLKKMTDEAIEHRCDELIAEPHLWKWASERPRDEYNYGRIEPARLRPTDQDKAALDEFKTDHVNFVENIWEKKRALELEIKRYSFNADERARSGCFVWVTGEGALAIDAGRIKPEERKAAAGKQQAAERKKKRAKAEAAGEPAAVSNALMQRMSEWLTAAASDALVHASREVALAALVAGVRSAGEKTVSLKSRGLAEKLSGKVTDLDFAKTFAQALKMKIGDLLQTVDHIVAAAFDFQVFHADHPPLKDDGVRALCEAIDPIHMGRSLLKAFDAETYFDSVSKPIVIAALREMEMKEDGVKALSSLSKKDLVAPAAKAARETKWLPSELRTCHYTGPRSRADAVHKVHPKGKRGVARKGQGRRTKH